MEVVVLAGGFGTRLQKVVKNVPKPMADINGKPFLSYILEYLVNQDVTKVILSIGYKKEIIENYFGNNYKTMQIIYSIENEPLGTGGAIKKALKLCHTSKPLVLNGDTFLDISLQDLRKYHYNSTNDISLALVRMENFDRYGSVELENNRVVSFKEKKHCKKGLINGGVYIMNNTIFDNYNLPISFSFEDFLTTNINQLITGANVVEKSYFIDIGIPEDYKKAQKDFKEIF